jgi:hypothetical protein
MLSTIHYDRPGPAPPRPGASPIQIYVTCNVYVFTGGAPSRARQ